MRTRLTILCMLALTIGAATLVAGQTAAAAPSTFQAPVPPPAPVLRDGSHDFDWQFGDWKTTVHRLKHPLSGSNEWVTYTGTINVSKVWDGKAHLLVLNLVGHQGYSPESAPLAINPHHPPVRRFAIKCPIN